MATILVIDDEPSVRRTLTRILERAGHEVIEARNGREGLRRFSDRQPHLVITDVYMPDKEGIETLCELHRDAPSVPIIVISGGATKSMPALDFAMKLGAHATLAKPFRSEDLIATVQRALPSA